LILNSDYLLRINGNSTATNYPSKTNHPSPFEIYLVPEGESKITYERDQKVKDAGTFRILREDHTLANLLRMQLLQNPKVLFCGYKVPHPLSYEVEIKLQTIGETDPMAVMRTEVDALINKVSDLKTKFMNELTLHGEFWGY
jgi:DNA-directed RNA polymerase II subunit RPB11